MRISSTHCDDGKLEGCERLEAYQGLSMVGQRRTPCISDNRHFSLSQVSWISNDLISHTSSSSIIHHDRSQNCVSSFSSRLSSSPELGPRVCLPLGKPCDQKVRVASTPFFPKSFAHLCPVGSCSQQNNLKELFLLLSFICPQIFIDYVGLDSFLPKDSDSTQIERARTSWKCCTTACTR